MGQELNAQVIATYTAYIDAFRANDVEPLDKLIQYPLAYIGNGRVTMVENFPVQPAELMAAKQWHDTKDLNPEAVFLSAEKAHVIVRHATRVRDDGSPIEIVSAFYALTCRPAGWKICASLTSPSQPDPKSAGAAKFLTHAPFPVIA
jgi:hypothetical protein